jgi:hypothetical protein
MSVCLLLISDGREDYLRQTLASLEANLPPFDHTIWVNDSAHKLGFAGAIQEGWSRVLDTGADWVWHMEQDFTFPSPVPLERLIALSESQPHLAQVSLRRQAWGAEIPHGGFMEMAPQWYTERDGWVETTRNWTTNPSLYRAELCGYGWPDAPDSEGHFGFMLREQGLPWGIPGDDVRFGFWGSMKDGANTCHHIGDKRAGIGY